MKRRHGRDAASVEARRQADVHGALSVLAARGDLPIAREVYRWLYEAGALSVERAA